MPPISLPMFPRKSLDNSILGKLGTCPRLALYNYGLNRAGRAQNYPINFGSAYHDFREALENIYVKWVLTDKQELEDCAALMFEAAWAIALRDWQDPPLEHKKSYLDSGRLLATCKGAFENWKQEKALGYYKVIGTETPFELELPSGRLFSGKLDQIVEWNRRLWIRDFKTTGRKEDWGKKFSPSHQFTGYVWAAQILSGRQIDGVIVDVVYNIKTKGPEFYPTLANRSLGDIEMWLEWVEDAQEEWYKRVEEDSWPMKTTACNNFAGCFFRDCCNTGNWSSVEQWLKERTIESHWDPLNPSKEKGLPE